MTFGDLSREERLELYYWMRLTRTYDERMVALWQQGRGLGGTFSQRGHEAISVAAGYTLEQDDVAAPMHRDLGCYLLRGLTPRRLFANMLGKASGVTRGRDANLHGIGDLDHNIAGFISHLGHSLSVAVGMAMCFNYRNEPRVALTFIGDGSSSTGVFHEAMNLAAVENAPVVVVVENNLYAYATPMSQQMKIEDIADRAASYGIPGLIVDGNDVEAVYDVVKQAVDRAWSGGGPTLVEAKTMRMLGHAIHDGAEYVPDELLAEWEAKDPLRRYEERLLVDDAIDQIELDEIGHRCDVEIEDAIEYAESSPLPEPSTIFDGVYAE